MLSGTELAEYIKARQARQVRMLRQAHHIVPKLLVLKSRGASAVINTYVRMKQRYAEDILIETEVVTCSDAEMVAIIDHANLDDTIHGIMVQLPLDDPSRTAAIVDTIAPKKDVDGLGVRAAFVSATAEAIDWLLAGYGITLTDKRILLIGRGKLVGAPLEAMWQSRGLNVTSIDAAVDDIASLLAPYDVIVSATGVGNLVRAADIPRGAIMIDAGTVSEGDAIIGDVEASARERRDIKITPTKGGVGPLTIVLMYDHVIQAAQRSIKTIS